jgi:hypothetical protein
MYLPFIAALVTYVLTAPVPGARAPECDAAHTLRVLFIGNSFTYLHNVPEQVRQIARALPGPCVETRMLAVGGASLEDHWRADSAAAAIRAGQWTHVVLNDQSTFRESWWLDGKPRIGTSGGELLDYGKRFVQLIRERAAKPLIIAHWAGVDANARDRQALDYVFASFARATGIEVADVGYAITRMQSELPALDPYHTDRHHLSAAGAHLEALIVYAALTGHSPLAAPRIIRGRAVEFMNGLVLDSIVPLIDLDDRSADALQKLADAAQRGSVRRLASLTPPPPLSAEYPQLPSDGDPVRRSDVEGNWSGNTTVLPNADSAGLPIEISADSVRIQAGPLRFTGLASIEIDGGVVVIRAPLMPPEGSTRSRPQPLLLELRGVRRGERLAGVATVRQQFQDNPAAFNAAGRFELRRPN